ncbi:Vacuolar protein sorting protein 25 [Zea mays]|nr:Vacuolar protein sorting protein 25 [Zea mays]
MDGQRSQEVPNSLAKDTGLGKFHIELCKVLLFPEVKDNGLEVMTIEEIRSGIDTRGTELEGIDRGVLMRALRQLEQKGKAAIFKGTSADDEGVKFSV